MKTYLIACLCCLAHLITAREVLSQSDTDRLLRLMPEQTCHLVIVNHFSDVWRSASAQTNSRSRGQALDLATASDSFQNQVGLSPALLAELDPIAMVHAEISGPDGAAQRLLVVQFVEPELVTDALARARSDLERSGALARAVRFGSVSGTQYTRESGAQASRTIVHISVRELLICATDASLAADVVRRVTNAGNEPKFDLPAAGSIAAKIALPGREDQPSLFWYSNPWCVAESAIAADARPDSWYERHGLKRIQALGGGIICPPDGTLLAQTVIIAPPPLTGSLGILQLTPASDWNPPQWLCSEFDELVLLHGDVPKAFESFGTIFDDLYADGIEGTYDAILEDLKDEGGLNIDLKTQLYKHLGPVVLLVRNPPPRDAPETQGAMTFAIQTQRPESVALAIATLFQDDPEARPISVAGCEEPFWLISGGGEGPDSGLVVTRGYLIYAEDAASLRRKLAAPPGSDSTLAAKIADIRESLPTAARRYPSAFWMRDGDSRPDAPARDGADVEVACLFLAPSHQWTKIRNGDQVGFVEVLTEFTPLLQQFSSGLGFNETDGWSLFTK